MPESNSKTSVGRAAGIFVDNDRKEFYVADGYLNSRVVKFMPGLAHFSRLGCVRGRATSSTLEAVLYSMKLPRFFPYVIESQRVISNFNY